MAFACLVRHILDLLLHLLHFSLWFSLFFHSGSILLHIRLARTIVFHISCFLYKILPSVDHDQYTPTGKAREIIPENPANFTAITSFRLDPQGIVSLCLLFEKLLQTHEPQLWSHFRELQIQPYASNLDYSC